MFVGPFEHHSNELPWRESIADVVTIPEDADGHIDLARLEAELIALRRPAAEDRLVLGGVERDRHRLEHVRHRRPAPPPRGAVVLGLRLPPRPTSTSRCTRSAPSIRWPTRTRVFISPHKFVGGPGTPGVLVVRRSLLRNRVPDVVGGGTVAYVNPTEHRYLDDPIHREEGGTPAIIESIRAGLVFQLKEAVGVATIKEHEESYWRRAVAAWSANPAIQVLGNTRSERLSILSFVVRRPGRSVPPPQLRRRPAQRSVRHPVPWRVLVRRAVRPPPPRASTSNARTSSSTRSPRAAKGSSPAGRASASTTSSPRRSSSTSSTPSIWSPSTDGSCCPSTGSTRQRDCGATIAGRSSRRCACRSCPTTRAPATCDARPSTTSARPRTRLAGYLDAARQRFAAAPAWTETDPHPGTLSAEFEHLRWFDLPAESLDG